MGYVGRNLETELIFTIAARQRPVKHAATVLVFVWNWKRTDAKRRK
jgi:hypothetical protein